MVFADVISPAATASMHQGFLQDSIAVTYAKKILFGTSFVVKSSFMI
jgi:hypothetical protein